MSTEFMDLDLRCKYISSSNFEKILKQGIRFTPTSFFNDENEFYSNRNSDLDILNHMAEQFSSTIIGDSDCEDKIRAARAMYHFLGVGGLFGKSSGCHPMDISRRDGAFLIDMLNDVVSKSALKKEILSLAESCGLGGDVVAKRYVDACIGVLCMTVRPDNVSAWKTYAGDGSGFCVVFSGGFINQANVEGNIQYITPGEKISPNKVLVRKSSVTHENLSDPLGEILKGELPADYLWRFYCKEKFGFDQFYDKAKKNLLDWSLEEEVRYLADIREYDYLTGKIIEKDNGNELSFINLASGKQPLKLVDINGECAKYIIAGENSSQMSVMSLFFSTLSSVTMYRNAVPVLRILVEGELKYLHSPEKILHWSTHPTFSIKSDKTEPKIAKIELDNPETISAKSMDRIFLAFLLSGYFAAQGNKDLMLEIMHDMYKRVLSVEEYIHQYGHQGDCKKIAGICRKILDLGVIDKRNGFDIGWLNSLGVKTSALSILEFSEKSSEILWDVYNTKLSTMDLVSLLREFYGMEIVDSLPGAVANEKAVFLRKRNSIESEIHSIGL